MPQLANHTSLTDATNARLKNLLSPARPGGDIKFLHVEGHQNLSGGRLSTGQEYPFTALGRLGVRLATTGETKVITQLRNRFNTDTGNTSSAQLILLDTASANLVQEALVRDAAQTALADPYSAFTALERNDPHVHWLLAHWPQAVAHMSRRAPSNEVNGHLLALRSSDMGLFNRVHTLIAYHNDAKAPRYRHHESKSAVRLGRHYTNLSAGLNTAQQVTEARGEYAAAKILVTVFSEEYQMKMGKGANGARPNGIDQIWVKRDPSTGSVAEYLIIEAKGSINADLGHPQDGQQMSARWLFVRLVRMAAGEANYIDLAHTKQRMAEKILDAMFDDSQAVKVRGIVLHSLYGTTNENQVVQITDLGAYNNPAALTDAQNNVGLFAGPVQTGLHLLQLK